MRVPEVCNANMTSLPIDIVHSLVKSQTRFQAGKLKHFLPQWEAITADPTILQIVTGVKLNLKAALHPRNITADLVSSTVTNIQLSTLKLINFSLKGSLFRWHRKQRNLFPQHFYDRKKMARTVQFLILKRLTNL